MRTKTRARLFKRLPRLLIIILISLINLFILFYPNEILKASKDGIVLWAANVLPTLLPFIICTNILINSGAVEFVGIFLEPLVYPLFKLPGCSAFALLSGMISGYPVGAKIACLLNNQQKISDSQVQKLISFCNNSGPLFILGTIGTAMLKNKNYGYFIMLAHYLSAIFLGLFLRFFNKHKKQKKVFFNIINREQIFDKQKNKSIAKLFSDSIHDAIETILHIGGFIVLFSVISKIIELSNIIIFFWDILSDNFSFIKKIGYKNFHGIIIGLIEMTNGAKIIASQNFSPDILIILSSLVSFGGLCVHMQSISFMAKTNIKISFYIIAKIFQAFIAGLIIKISFLFINLNIPAASIDNNIPDKKYNFWSYIIISFKNFSVMIILYITLVFILWLFKYFKIRSKNKI